MRIKHFLFVSIDGMTDPLGQSQVLPYLVNLAQKGYVISIVSCEKKENWNLHHPTIETIVNEAGISWNYCFYKTGKPFISQLQNYQSLKNLVIKKIKQTNNNTILHCRSYLAGLIGLYCKKKYNTGFIFDMRGFWADERIEGGIWNKKNIIGFYLYSYFKKKEKEMIIASDYIISLTHKAKSIILTWKLPIDSSKISVIPCCVDLEHFSEQHINKTQLELIKQQFPELRNQFVLSYIGSLGTWYMMDDMLSFFKSLSEKTNAVFLIITKDSKDIVYTTAEKLGIDIKKLFITSSSRENMPYYIALSSASLFFIKPSFSKLASSPTKMGEILSMGIPIITNSGVGDVDTIVKETKCGVLIDQFNNQDYEKAISDLLEHRNEYMNNTINTAKTYFSLMDGVETYAKIYNLCNSLK